MTLVLLKTRNSTVAVNASEVSDMRPYQTDVGLQTLIIMRNRIEHVVFEPMATVMAKLDERNKVIPQRNGGWMP
jgi:hypothetical protein